MIWKLLSRVAFRSSNWINVETLRLIWIVTRHSLLSSCSTELFIGGVSNGRCEVGLMIGHRVNLCIFFLCLAWLIEPHRRYAFEVKWEFCSFHSAIIDLCYFPFDNWNYNIEFIIWIVASGTMKNSAHIVWIILDKCLDNRIAFDIYCIAKSLRFSHIMIMVFEDLVAFVCATLR